ncbi:MAG TPA: GGDEF domain-containing protein [Geothrix sp.]|nr:GGDEF domain-containing protein [Geothrix sp.]
MTANMADRDAAEGQWALIRYVGHPLGEIIPLPSRGLSIGRSQENLLRLDEPEISRQHARVDISEDGQGAWIRDLGSTNGLFVNGRKVDARREAILLISGDVIRVGGHAFKLKCLDALDRQYHQGVVIQTTVDSLTGVNTRATLLHQLEKHYELARRHGRALSLILADLDHFKQINDTYGHAAGDQVLLRFGGILLGRLRGSDHVGRIGGEEFLLVLPETTADLALTVAEQLRLNLERERIEYLGQIIPATCSLGVAELDPAESSSGSLLARADAALYRAKASGRNRAVSAAS